MKKNPGNLREEKIITTTCSYDCGGRCLLEVHVSNNKVVLVKSGQTYDLHIKACPRGLIQKEVLHSMERLKTPLKRTGDRGSGRFQPISWEEALDIISARLRNVINKYGSESIYFIPGSGSESTLHDCSAVAGRFFGMLGKCTTTWGNPSFEAARQSSMATFGSTKTGSTRDNLLYSRYIILWGWDPVVTRFGSHTVYYLRKARAAGARIISVDPRQNRTAQSLAHGWIPLRPGTDTAMLISMAYVMICENIYDRNYVERYTYGFSRFHDYVMGKEDGVPKSPEWAQNICGVPSHEIREVARDYARIRPAALMTGWAPGRSAYGEQFHRAASVLAAMTGNIGVKGGFVSGGTDVLGLGRIDRKLPVPDVDHNVIHNTELYDLLLNNGKDREQAGCRLLYIIGANVLNQYLNLNKGINALRGTEFIIVHELFLTPTARFADIVLPVNHYMEREDLGFPWIGGPYTIFMNRVVEPEKDTRSDLEIFTQIAERIGLEGYNDYNAREWMEKIAGDVPGLENIDRLESAGIIRLGKENPEVAFSDEINNPDKYRFPTPSGRIEIFSNMFNDLDDPRIPPIPKYIPAWEGYDDEKRKDYPIQLLTPHARLRINSQLDNIDRIKSGSEDWIWINCEDARKRNIKKADKVVVFNSRGKIRARANVTDKIIRGTASIDQGKWYNPDEDGTDNGGNANVLTLDRMSPAGAFTSNTCLVQIEKE